MNSNSYNFIKGLISGATASVLVGGILLYTLNVLGYAVIQFPQYSGINTLVNFIYANLKLSIIPFILVFIGYIKLLNTLHTQLSIQQKSIDQIAQTEHLIDSCISLARLTYQRRKQMRLFTTPDKSLSTLNKEIASVTRQIRNLMV